MDLGHQRAHRVDHVPAPFDGRGHYFGCRAVSREHDRAAFGYFADVVNENHTRGFETLNHQLVVDNLVVAVHGRFKCPDHPGKRLDSHLHPGAESSGRR